MRPLLFNLSSTPWRPPPSQLSSLHILLHLLLYSSGSPQPSSAAVCIKKKGGPIVPPDSVCPLQSLWGLTQTHKRILPNQWRTGRVFVCAKPNQITFRKIMIFETLPTIGDRDQGELKLEIPAGPGL